MFDSATSSSGLWTAAARARETRRSDALFDDDLAEQLSGEEGRKQLAAREPDGVENPYLPIRTRFFDDLVPASAVSMQQIVLLGAGMDTRAFRLGLRRSMSVFEVDRAAVLQYKQQALDGASPTCDRRTVSANLDEEWIPALMLAGFRSDAPTLWIAEGLLFYLTTSAVRGLLQETAQVSASGSEFAADVFGTGLPQLPSMRPLVDGRQARGIELPFCCDDPESILEDSGWSDTHITPAYEFAAKLGRSTTTAESTPPRVTTLTSSFFTATLPKH